MPTHQMIFIGRNLDIDFDETNFNAEYAQADYANQMLGSQTNPLYDRVVSVTLNDTNNDGVILHNNHSGAQETISYTLSDGTTVTDEVDSGFLATSAQVTRRLPDGTTDTVITTVRVFQDVSGNTFILPPPRVAASSEVSAMTDFPIISIQMPPANFFTTLYDRVYTSRYDARSFVSCFTRGTLIDSEYGEAPVENLQQGDLVMTRDAGMQPIRWISRETISRHRLRDKPNLRPVRIRAGALGDNLPVADLVVSPQHRVLVRSTIAQRMFGTSEVLVAAKTLLPLSNVEIAEDVQTVEYFHFMFDAHQIVTSNGAPTESFYPGPGALTSLNDTARHELLEIFPELKGEPGVAPARPLIPMRRARSLLRRHSDNAKPLMSQRSNAA